MSVLECLPDAARQQPFTGDSLIDDHKRDHIVAAACTVLHRARYRNLKVLVVARAAGVSIGALYRVFDSKDALLAAVFREEVSRAARLLSEVTETGTPAERVHAWVEAMVPLGLERQQERAQWFNTLPEGVVRLAMIEGDPAMDVAVPLRAAVADGIADGSFPNADVVWDSYLIESLCSRLCTSKSLWGDAEATFTVPKVSAFILGSLRRGAAPMASAQPAGAVTPV